MKLLRNPQPWSFQPLSTMQERSRISGIAAQRLIMGMVQQFREQTNPAISRLRITLEQCTTIAL